MLRKICWMVFVALVLIAGSLALTKPVQADRNQYTACPDAYPTRLKIGDTVILTQDEVLHSRPDFSKQGMIEGNSFITKGETVIIIAGPICGALNRWYTVNSNGQVGMIPEVGPDGIYKLDPAPASNTWPDSFDRSVERSSPM